MLTAAIVGAGSIAEVHAAVLTRLPGVRVAAVIDRDRERADALARRWQIPKAGSDLAILWDTPCDVVHVLTPPPSHAAVAETVLTNGRHLFLEKPMAETGADCAALLRLAESKGVAFGVNHNFVHHPAYRRARAAIEAGTIGTVEMVQAVYAVPLRQLAARQFGHWMFDSPRNLLLEQVVHPLSQLDELLGGLTTVAILPQSPLDLGAGQLVQTRWLINLDGAAAGGQLAVTLGASCPAWTLTVLGTDGQVEIDILADRVVIDVPTRWIDAADTYRRGVRAAAALGRDSRRNALDYGLSLVRLKPRSDPFYRSMHASIAAFYRDLAAGPPRVGRSAIQGERLVGLCERIAAAGPPPVPRPSPRPVADDDRFDVLVIGGTGFIGSRLVAGLLAKGLRVAVLSRTPRNLPPLFADPRVGVVRGDVGVEAEVRRAVALAPTVIHLAQGGGGTVWSDFERGMVSAARRVADACRDAGADRLIYASSIAALYLGDPGAVATAATAPDPHAERRGLYARAKAEAERALLALARERGLPLIIARPGLVVGAGTSPFHSGVGYYNRDQHILGWNQGLNPLPFVLVDDVADALVRMVEAPVVNRCFNLVGDVRPTARAYVDLLARHLRRPLRYHPQSPLGLSLEEIAKWAVKRAIGRRDALFPHPADIRSRGLVTPFDCSAEKAALAWHPEADPDRFAARAILVHHK